MLSLNQLKYLKSLHQRKYRQKYGIFIAEGVKTADEVLQNNQFEIEGVFALQSWLDSNAERLEQYRNKVHAVTEKDLKKISLFQSPNQVLITLKAVEYRFSKVEGENSLSLYLDNIKDPGNMGTILRIADWFGIKWVFCSNECVEVNNPKVVQASMGAFLRVKTLTLPIEQLCSLMPGVPIIGMALDGVSLFTNPVSVPAVLVVGNESNGISEETDPFLTMRISIPRHPEGGAESLNAAIATGIICATIQNS